MLLHEIISLFESINLLLTEGFKDDMYRLYPEAKDDSAFNNAIKIYNSNENKIRDAVKKKITVNGSVAKAIKDKFPNSGSFINFIDDLSKELSQKAKESAEKQKQLEKSKSHQLKLKIGDEYRQIRAGKLDASPTDYWLIPCHTFEEAHAAASRYTGNLPRLSKEEITEKYGINAPESANYFRTNQTPTEFLEYLKNENRFFIPPTWCVAAGESYFNNTYNLKTKPDEKAKCYIIISKKYPNVRFCVVLNGSTATLKDDLVYQKAKIKELRDPWQIGGSDEINAGIEMMKAAFGENGAKKILQKVLDIDVKKLSDIVDGKSLFYSNRNIIKIDTSLANLKNADSMFEYCHSLKSFNSDLPALVDGRFMFFGCSQLKRVSIIDLSSLKNGESMFGLCEQLSSFDTEKMPLLEKGDMMFTGTNLYHFKVDVPKLKSGTNMFANCKHLYTFDADVAVLENGSNMFDGCKKLYFFRR